jgi:hypothetical protein
VTPARQTIPVGQGLLNEQGIEQVSPTHSTVNPETSGQSLASSHGGVHVFDEPGHLEPSMGHWLSEEHIP